MFLFTNCYFGLKLLASLAENIYNAVWIKTIKTQSRNATQKARFHKYVSMMRNTSDNKKVFLFLIRLHENLVSQNHKKNRTQTEIRPC